LHNLKLKSMTRIKEILKEQGLTVAELAEKLSVSRQALSKQIQGKMLVETAERIANVLEVPMWQLFASPEEVQQRKGEDEAVITCPYCGERIAVRIDIGL